MSNFRFTGLIRSFGWVKSVRAHLRKKQFYLPRFAAYGLSFGRKSSRVGVRRRFLGLALFCQIALFNLGNCADEVSDDGEFARGLSHRAGQAAGPAPSGDQAQRPRTRKKLGSADPRNSVGGSKSPEGLTSRLIQGGSRYSANSVPAEMLEPEREISNLLPHDRDRTFTIALRRLPASLDPLTALEPWGQRIVEDLVFEGLVRRHKYRRPWVEPQLADRWIQDDPRAPKQIDFHLRSGPKFHDGSELQVEDVIYTFSRLLEHSRSRLRDRMGLAFLQSVEPLSQIPRGEIADSGTSGTGRWLRINFSQGQPLALERISQVKIVPRSIHSAAGVSFASHPVGTGPMRVQMNKERIVLERIESGARADREAISVASIVFEQISDGAQAFTALRRNEVQLLAELPPSYLPAELGKPGLAARAKAWLTSPARYDLLMYNLQDPLTIDLGVRRAINELIPQDSVAATAYHAAGLDVEAPVDLHDPIALDLALFRDAHRGEVGVGGLPKWPEVDQERRERVIRSLEELGWKMTREGRKRAQTKLRLTLTWEGVPGAGAAVASLLRESWRSAGIVEYQATAPWGYLQKLLEQGKFQTALVRLALAEDSDLFDYYHSDGVLNHGRVSDAQLDRALETYRRAETRLDRVRAEEEIAERFSTLHVASVLHAPVVVMLTTREVKELEFIDDLPRLDRLAWEHQPENGWYPPSLSSVPP